ncbi:hypothetical protein VTL71DRAFT_2360 [Oculimacula yallundae]|uniref:Uncharacterized protein n=1 Tax=Oculimacula yallundae TaxID=86028 RepID=A0ABR4CAN4_9HELO
MGGCGGIRCYTTSSFLQSSLPPCSAFLGLADDREKMLRSTDRGGKRRDLLPWISLHEKDSINVEAFLTVRTSGSKVWQDLYGGPQSGSARVVRAYMSPLIPPSGIII